VGCTFTAGTSRNKKNTTKYLKFAVNTLKKIAETRPSPASPSSNFDLQTWAPAVPPGTKPLGEALAFVAALRSEKILQQRRKNIPEKLISRSAGPSFWPRIEAAVPLRRLGTDACTIDSEGTHAYLAAADIVSTLISSPSLTPSRNVNICFDQQNMRHMISS
jgi:hypothetical protein